MGEAGVASQAYWNLSRVDPWSLKRTGPVFNSIPGTILRVVWSARRRFSLSSVGCILSGTSSVARQPEPREFPIVCSRARLSRFGSDDGADHPLVSDVDRALLTHDYVLRDDVGAISRRAVGVTVVLAICFNGEWIGDLRSWQRYVSMPVRRDDPLAVMGVTQELGLVALWYGVQGISMIGDYCLVEREAKITGEGLRSVENLADLPGEPGKIMYVRAHIDGDIGFAAFTAALCREPRHRQFASATARNRAARHIEACRRRVGRPACWRRSGIHRCGW